MADCQKYIEKMNAYLDGALPASEISSLLEHMEKCPSCRARFESLKIISFEMRHLNRETPPGLHDSIMAHVTAGKKPSKRAYTRIFATVAAAAAITIFAVKGDFFDLSRVYLFGSETEVAGEAAKTPIIQTEPKDTAPEEPKNGHDPLSAIPQSPLQGKKKPKIAEDPSVTSAPPASAQPPAAQPPIANAPSIAEKPNDPLPPNSTEPDVQMDAPIGRPVLGAKKEPNATEPFRVPALPTDEEFGFYCVAVGNGKVPTEFPTETIIGDTKKGPIYIYVENTAQAHKQAEEALQNEGFTIMRAATNLPAIVADSDYGLIIIFKQ